MLVYRVPPPPQGSQPHPIVELPPEFFLREAFEFNSLDPIETCAFVRTWGSFTTPRHESGLCAYLPMNVRYSDALYASLEREAASYREANRLHPLDEDAAPVEAERVHIEALRTLVDHWTAYVDGNGSGIVEAWENHLWPRPDSTGQAWAWFDMFLNSALQPFHIRVASGHLGAEPYDQAGLSTYCLAALQLANALAEHATVRRCANEACRRRFVRQLGRSQYSQHRTQGVLYCSKNCARAQANRQYRRRKKQNAKG